MSETEKGEKGKKEGTITTASKDTQEDTGLAEYIRLTT